MQMPGHQLFGRGYSRGIILKSRQPMNQRFFAEPCDLSFGVAPRGLRNCFPGSSQRDRAFKVRAQLAVPDEVEWLRLEWDAAAYQAGDFIEPTALQHRMHAPLDPVVQRGTRRLQADLDRAIPFKSRASGLMDFGLRAPGEQADFNGANHLG